MERLTRHTPVKFGYCEYQIGPHVDEEDFINRLGTYEDIAENVALSRLEEICAAERDGRCVVLPKDAHQPAFVKSDAIDIFDQWNDITGAIPTGTSWYYEAQSVVEEVAAMAFGAGVFYEAERHEAAPAQEGRNKG